MIMSSASQLRARRRQHRLAKRTSFALVELTFRGHCGRSVDDNAGFDACDEGFDDVVGHEAISCPV